MLFHELQIIIRIGMIIPDQIEPLEKEVNPD